jgi:predicted  nucleic acid-binding Zn-ribbon protein
MKRISTIALLCLLLSSCVSMKRYKQDMAKIGADPVKLAKLDDLQKEVQSLKERLDKRENSIVKLQSQLQLLEKKISDLQKAPVKTEEIKKNQKSSYKP